MTALAATGCLADGQVGPTTDPPDPPPNTNEPPPTNPTPGGCVAEPMPLRRLTRDQIARTLDAALGVNVDAEVLLPPDGFAGPFPAGTQLSEPFVRSLMDVAERAGDRFAADLPCTFGDACLSQLLTTLGPGLIRRAFTAEESARLSEIHAAGVATEGTFERGVAWMVSAIVQSPDFLFLVEPTSAERADPASMAARLAYFLWEAPPDEALLSAASDGTLESVEGLRAQAVRMLDDPKSRAVVERFVVGWLDLSRLDQVAKSERYLRFDAAARAAMRNETYRFADVIMRRGQGNLHTLFSARWSYLSESLFPIYDMARPTDFDPGVPVSLLDGQRYGILTHGSVMTVHAAFDDSSPTARGSMILDNLVCQPIPLPNLDIPELPEPVPGQSNRARFEQHTSNPACATCHSIIDPIGFALEGYDAIGGYRTAYASGEPVDNVGGLNLGDPNADGEAVGAQALSDRLLQSADLPQCFVTQWMRLGLGRTLTANDLCVRDALVASFAETNYDIRTLILNFIVSDAFRAAPGDA